LRAAALFLIACSSTTEVDVDASGCVDEVKLRVTDSRIYALAQVHGADVALLVDTGSQTTFLSTNSTRPVPSAGELHFGCSTRTVAGRPIHSEETIDGRAVVGFLGNDFFLETPRVIDLAAQTIRAGTCDGVRIAYENRSNYLFVGAIVDGHQLRLGFDTGAPHALWLGRQPTPGDQAVATQDAYGNPITLYLGTAAIELGGPSRSVPILRAPSFPSLEDSNRALGGGIDGLVGLSTLGATKICFDATSSTITLAN
jgi:hypothetical protein